MFVIDPTETANGNKIVRAAVQTCPYGLALVTAAERAGTRPAPTVSYNDPNTRANCRGVLQYAPTGPASVANVAASILPAVFEVDTSWKLVLRSGANVP